jgi:Flp pilus assembly protein TadD/lysophospholipase L1-like esterase
MKPTKKGKKADPRKNRGRDPKSPPATQLQSKSGGPFVRDFGIGLLVCALFFVLVEGLLRISGVPTRDFSDDPFVGFSGIQPLFSVKDGIASTTPSKLKFFNEASFKVPKPDGTVRVFCFGGSTTYGHPFDGRTAFSKWLQDLLKASSPETDFEVINAGGISYASYRIVPLIKETLKYQPDLMIIYTGHNEFLEKRTYAGLLDQGGILLTLQGWLEELNTYRALRLVLKPFLPDQTAKDPKSKDTDEQKTGKPVLKEEVSAILDRSAGLELYHRDEEFARGVVEHFAHNLRAMIALCKDAGVPVMIVEPASNLKDFSPFKSEHDQRLSASEKKGISTSLSETTRLLESGNHQEAAKLAEDTKLKDPLFAESHFLQGRALLMTGRYPEAKSSFEKAKDLDVCPLRCISEVEGQILTIAKENKVIVVPFSEALESYASESGDKSGIPGNESFLDHLHPTIEKHQLLAEMILQQIQSAGLMKFSRNLSAEERQAILKQGMNDIDPSFFALRDLNLAKTLRWAGKKDEARFALENAAQRLPENPEIHKMLGGYLLEDGNYNRAIDEYKTAVELSKGDPDLEFSLAVAYYRSGRIGEAISAYRRLTNSESPLPEAFANLAMINLEEGNVQDALELLKRGLTLSPDASALYSPYALSLALSGRVPEAIPWMNRAVKAEPGSPSHFYNLAGMYSLSGENAEAIRHLHLAVKKGYSDADKLARDPVFAPLKNLPEFKQILLKIQ